MFSFADARAELHYRMANVLVRLRLYGAAAKAYGRALHISPSDQGTEFMRAWCLLIVPNRRVGVSLSRLRRWKEAAEAYENAAHLNPSEADAWEGLRSAYVMLSRWRDAAACYERVRRLSPTLGRGVDAAYVLMEVNRLEEAESLLREALKVDPHCLDTKELFALTLAGLDRYDESVRVARDICATDPKRSSAHATLGMVLAEAGRLDEALSEAKAAVEIAHQDCYAQGAVGTVYLKMNHGAAAFAAFERARESLAMATAPPDPPTSARCAGGRGAALSLLGRHDEAMLAFDELLRLEPDFFETWPEQAAPYELSRRETKGRS